MTDQQPPKQKKISPEELAKIARLRELNDIRAVLSTEQGRRFLWRLMGHCKVNQSVFEQSSKIYYNSGQQDIGHFIMGEVIESDPDKFNLMRDEACKAAEKEI